MSYKISLDANGSDIIHVHNMGYYAPVAKLQELTSIICNGALTGPIGSGTLVEFAEKSMNELLAANVAYRGLLEKVRYLSPLIEECLNATPEALLIRLSEQIRQEHRQLLGEMAARVNHLTQLVHAAQKDYIERHSDGETDCVTPYDTYDQPGIECVRQLQAVAVIDFATETAKRDEYIGTTILDDARSWGQYICKGKVGA